MLAHHRGLGITPGQRHRFASTMSLAADDAGLPADPEFRAALIGDVEWAARPGARGAPLGVRGGGPPPGHAQLTAGRPGRGRAGPGPPLGLGRGPAVPGLSRQKSTLEAQLEVGSTLPTNGWSVAVPGQRSASNLKTP